MNFDFKKKQTSIFLLLIAGVLVGTALNIAVAKSGVQLAATGTTSLAPEIVTEEAQLTLLLERALPSVVSVVGLEEKEGGGATSISRGTGFVVDASGIVITNRHVVADKSLTYRVYFPDGRRFPATVAARDTLKDVAILTIPGDGFSALPLGDSDKVKVGHTTLAIGNSLGRYPNSVTRGIVSGLGRQLSASADGGGKFESLEDVIQTDAEINVGNSGGPLLNSRGEVIGINTAIDSQGRGVGFAIPINDAKTSLASYKKNGRIIRPYLGLRYLTITPDIQDERHLTYDYGALVDAGTPPSGAAVVPNGPAAKAGLQLGDIILSVDGVLVRGDKTLLKLIQLKQVGQEVLLRVNRVGKSLNVGVVLDEVPGSVE